MELTAVDLGVRLVSVITDIKKEQLIADKLSNEQQQDAIESIERLSRSRLHMVHGSGYTSSDVRAYELQVQATEAAKPALIVVDYVQLLCDQEGDGRLRERNVSAPARGLKQPSGELEGPPCFPGTPETPELGRLVAYITFVMKVAQSLRSGVGGGDRLLVLLPNLIATRALPVLHRIIEGGERLPPEDDVVHSIDQILCEQRGLALVGLRMVGISWVEGEVRLDRLLHAVHKRAVLGGRRPVLRVRSAGEVLKWHGGLGFAPVVKNRVAIRIWGPVHILQPVCHEQILLRAERRRQPVHDA
ncbi:MAG: hypothetical protein JO057_23305 [Chloroflexi bacterium]|nr:hypothetical protein [Chloroflexota bacterium]